MRAERKLSRPSENSGYRLMRMQHGGAGGKAVEAREHAGAAYQSGMPARGSTHRMGREVLGTAIVSETDIVSGIGHIAGRTEPLQQAYPFWDVPTPSTSREAQTMFAKCLQVFQSDDNSQAFTTTDEVWVLVDFCQLVRSFSSAWERFLSLCGASWDGAVRAS